MSNPVSNAVVPIAPSCPQLPGEVLLPIFSHLEGSAIGVCLKVSRLWRAWASELLIRELAFLPETRCFGPREWSHYWGDVEKGPGLPANFFDLLAQSCPFFPGKRKSQTHKLIYMPQEVDGQDLTSDELYTLVKKPRHGTSFSFFLMYPDLKDIVRHSSYWALALTDIIPESEKSPKEINALKRLLMNTLYEIPSSREALICSLASGVLAGKLLYPPSTTTATTRTFLCTLSTSYCNLLSTEPQRTYIGSNICRNRLAVEYLSKNNRGQSYHRDGLAPVWRLPPGPLDPDVLGGATRSLES